MHVWITTSKSLMLRPALPRLLRAGDEAEAAVLVTTALPSPPSGQTYEMWFIDADGKARAAGLPEADGELTPDFDPGGSGGNEEV